MKKFLLAVAGMLLLGSPAFGAQSEAERQGQQPQQDAGQEARGPAIATFDCVRSDNPRVTTTLVVDFTSSSVKSLNGFGGIGAGVGAQITDATISWKNRVIKNYGGGGVLDFAGSIDRATRNFTFMGSDNSTFIFKCESLDTGRRANAHGTSMPDIPPPPRPTDNPPKTIALGQTKDEVVTILGQPYKIVNLSGKEIYYYPDMKVTFARNKVADVQ